MPLLPYVTFQNQGATTIRVRQPLFRSRLLDTDGRVGGIRTTVPSVSAAPEHFLDGFHCIQFDVQVTLPEVPTSELGSAIHLYRYLKEQQYQHRNVFVRYAGTEPHCLLHRGGGGSVPPTHNRPAHNVAGGVGSPLVGWRGQTVFHR